MKAYSITLHVWNWCLVKHELVEYTWFNYDTFVMSLLLEKDYEHLQQRPWNEIDKENKLLEVNNEKNEVEEHVQIEDNDYIVRMVVLIRS